MKEGFEPRTSQLPGDISSWVVELGSLSDTLEMMRSREREVCMGHIAVRDPWNEEID